LIASMASVGVSAQPGRAINSDMFEALRRPLPQLAQPEHQVP